MTSSNTFAAPRQFQPDPGDLVLTPTGKLAVVIDVSRETLEATIQWLDNAERACFRLSKLMPAPA